MKNPKKRRGVVNNHRLNISRVWMLYLHSSKQSSKLKAQSSKLKAPTINSHGAQPASNVEHCSILEDGIGLSFRLHYLKHCYFHSSLTAPPSPRSPSPPFLFSFLRLWRWNHSLWRRRLARTTSSSSSFFRIQSPLCPNWSWSFSSISIF